MNTRVELFDTERVRGALDTTDGEPDHPWHVIHPDAADWGGPPPLANWSPDGRFVAAWRSDLRGVPRKPVVHWRQPFGHPLHRQHRARAIPKVEWEPSAPPRSSSDGQSLRSEGEKGMQEMTTRPSLVSWTLANGIGMAVGFLAFIQTLMFLGFGLDFRSHWSVADVEALESTIGSDSMERMLRIGLVIGLPLAGLVVATSQAWVLRRFLPRIRLWVLTGPAGFAAIILVIWPFTAIWGDIPGPVEPLTIVGGGMLATGVLQWLLLRRRGVHATRWLTLWLLGLPLGMLVTTAVIVGAGETVGYPPWPLEIALTGFFVGGTAAGLSGLALLDRIEPPARAGDVRERKEDVAT